MFVFPAFDSNYKTRKRTFKCCRTCRTKRMRCIQLENYEAFGCDNCKNSRVECDLIVISGQGAGAGAGGQNSQSSSKRASPMSQEHIQGEPSVPQWEDGSNLSSPYFIPQIGQQYPIQHQLQVNLQQLPQHQPQVLHHHLYHQQPPSYEYLKQFHEQMNIVPLGPFHAVAGPPTPMSQLFQQYPDPGYQGAYQQLPQPGISTAQGPTVGRIPTHDGQRLAGQPAGHIRSPLVSPPVFQSSTLPHQLQQRLGMNFQEEYIPENTAKHRSTTRRIVKPLLHSVHSSETEPRVAGDVHGRRKDRKVEDRSPAPKEAGDDKAPAPKVAGDDKSRAPKEADDKTPAPKEADHNKSETQIDELKRDSPSETDSSRLTIQAATLPIEPLTAQYLKKKFNFNVSQKKRNQSLSKVMSRKLIDLDGDIEPRVEKAIESEMMCNFLLSIKAFTLELDHQTTLELVELYFFKVNSIFPIIQESKFRIDFENNCVPNIIIYAIVLVISRDKSAEKIFIKNNVFNGNNFDVLLRTFFKSLILKIRMLLLISPELGDNDLLNRLVCQLLLVLHFNFDRFGTNACFNDLTDSINIIKELCISNQRDEYLVELWWICYFFDRIGSIVNTRALVIKDCFSERLALPKNEHLLALVKCAQILYPMAIKTLLPQVDKLDLETTEYIDQELARQEEDLRSDFQFAFHKNHNQKPTKYYLPPIELHKYCTNMTYLIERFCHCLVISLLHKHTLESRLNTKDCTGISDVPLVVSSNTLKYIQYFNNHEDFINISLFPTVLCLGVSIHLRHKFRGTARKSPIPPNVKFVKYMPRWNQMTYDYLDLFTYKLINELKKFSNKWWFVNEIIAGTISVCQRLSDVQFKEEGVEDRRPSPKRAKLDIQQARERLKIESLLTYDDHDAGSNVDKVEDDAEAPNYYINDYTLETPKFIEKAMSAKKEKDFKLIPTFEVKEKLGDEKDSTLNTIESLALTFFPDDVWKRVNDVPQQEDLE